LPKQSDFVNEHSIEILCRKSTKSNTNAIDIVCRQLEHPLHIIIPFSILKAFSTPPTLGPAPGRGPIGTVVETKSIVRFHAIGVEGEDYLEFCNIAIIRLFNRILLENTKA